MQTQVRPTVEKYRDKYLPYAPDGRSVERRAPYVGDGRGGGQLDGVSGCATGAWGIWRGVGAARLVCRRELLRCRPRAAVPLRRDRYRSVAALWRIGRRPVAVAPHLCDLGGQLP